MKTMGPSDLIAILALVISIATACLSFYQANRIASSSEKSAAIETKRGHLTALLGKLIEIEGDWAALGARKKLYTLRAIDSLESSSQERDEIESEIRNEINNLDVESALILRRARDLFVAYRYHLSDKNIEKLRISFDAATDEDETLEFIRDFQSAAQKELEGLKR